MPRLRIVDPTAERRASVPKNVREIVPEYFCGSDGKPFRLEDFHVEVLDAMFEGGQLVVNLPTDHAKSTLGTFLFPLLSLMENPDETHIICGANINDSRRRVQALELEIVTNKALTRDFPWVARPEERDGRIWTATQFNVAGRTVNKPNPSVLAASVGGADIKGRRGKLVMDDIEGEEAQWSPLKRLQMFSWLMQEAWRCYEDKAESPRPLQCLMGTPFDVDSIYFAVQRFGWKVIRYPVYLSERLVTYPQTGTQQWQRDYLWNDKADKVEIARKRLRKQAFSVSYLMDPTGGDPSRISSEQIKERVQESPQIEEEFSGFISLDPATGGQGPRMDYAGIAVMKIRWPQGDELPQVELLECHNFTQGLFEQVHFCANLHYQYGFPVVYEGNGQQGGVYQQTFMHLHPQVPLIRHYTSHQNKFDTSMGLTVVKRLVVDRKMFVPQEQLESEGIQAFIQEVRDLQPPFKLHNHICAAIWFAVRYAYERARHYRAKVNLAYNPLNPMSGNGVWPGFQDDPMLTPLQRAERAMAYDFAARNPNLFTQFGYGAWGSRVPSILEVERRKEEERWAAIVNRRRAS